MRDGIGKKSALAAGFLAAALGMRSDHGTHGGKTQPEAEPTEQTAPPTADDDPETRARRERARQTHQRFEDALRALKERVAQQQELSMTDLSKTEVTDDDLLEFAEERAQQYPKNPTGQPEFLRLMETMHVDHDGNSYYFYSDSLPLNAYADRFSLIHLEGMMTLEQGEDMRGQPEYYLEVYVDTPDGLQRIGSSIMVSTPEQIKFRIAEHINDEVARLVINGFPNLHTPTP